ncbi:unnamed protein product [Dibothriocephalus latus]|uniref:Uncharacterized protein n=1 Tax=Dibothriocephalus latus TaxID=60516 RepID=A0A3P6PN02_DIBLA|nr:unnamed protein product [Dibothriocephalus latus]
MPSLSTHPPYSYRHGRLSPDAVHHTSNEIKIYCVQQSSSPFCFQHSATTFTTDAQLSDAPLPSTVNTTLPTATPSFTVNHYRHNPPHALHPSGASSSATTSVTTSPLTK